MMLCSAEQVGSIMDSSCMALDGVGKVRGPIVRGPTAWRFYLLQRSAQAEQGTPRVAKSGDRGKVTTTRHQVYTAKVAFLAGVIAIDEKISCLTAPLIEARFVPTGFIENEYECRPAD
jgi:hypothetical protein